MVNEKYVSEANLQETKPKFDTYMLEYVFEIKHNSGYDNQNTEFPN